MAQGTLRSPAFTVATNGTSVLEFDLSLDTTWARINEATELPEGITTFIESVHQDYMDSPAEDATVFFTAGGSTFKEQLLYVRVITSDGSSETATNVWYSGYIGGFTSETTRVSIDLTPWAGQSIQVEWFFSSYFEPIFVSKGALIDRVMLSSTCADPVECVGPQDCPFDLDQCSANTCENFTCGTRPGPGVGCCLPLTVFEGGFEGGTLDALGYTVDDPTPDDGVTWQTSTLQANTGTQAAYYGNPALGNYVSANAKNSATLTTPTIALPANQDFTLSFWIFQETEAFTVGWEDLRIEVVPMGGAGQAVTLVDTFFTSNGSPENQAQVTPEAVPELQWHKITLGDFGALAGQDVVVRIIFDTFDDVNNSTVGLFIDDLRVETLCP